MTRPSFVPALLGVLTACSSSTRRHELSAAHPAHSRTAEASYVHPVQDWTSEAFGALSPDSIDGYVCPMHGQRTSATPGQCIECGMDLLPHHRVQSP